MSAGTGHAYNEACDVVNLEIWLSKNITVTARMLI